MRPGIERSIKKEIDFTLDVSHIERFGRNFAGNDRISKRIVFAIVVASLIIGSSLIVLSGIPPKWRDIPVVGIAGFLAAVLMGF